MLHHSLDTIFHALGDPTRRAIVEKLASGAATISDLAAPFPVTLTAIGQHVSVLEASGLVHTRKVGRVRTVELRQSTLAAAERWFEQHRRRWEERFDRLGAVLGDDDVPPPTSLPPHPTKRKRTP